MRPKRRCMHSIPSRLLVSVTAALVLTLAAGVPPAAGTAAASGTDTFTSPRTAADCGIAPMVETTDTYGVAELSAMADRQGRYDTWLAEKAISPLLVHAPASYFLATPLHQQQTDHWCGPATVEIIDDYWGPIVSGATDYARQQKYAASLGTTTAGTNFTVVDNALNACVTESGVTYLYRAGMRTRQAIFDLVQSDVGISHYPLAADLRINAATNLNWRPYRYDHGGHIVPIDGYNYNVGYYRIRLNDPNNESRWHTGGGDTDGRHSYPRLTLANGVLTSFRPDMIW